MAEHKEPDEFGSFATHVPRFDTLLGGGLIEGSLYLIEGMPGGGKTLLASQIAFAQAERGRKVVYLTLIAESHAKLIHHLSRLAFFRPAVIGNRLLFLSGYQELFRGRHRALLELLADIVRRHKPYLLVIDGFRQLIDASDSDADIVTFVHELGAFAMTARCTVLLLAAYRGITARPEHALVDGLIELQRTNVGMRSVREIEVHKVRAADHRRGRHFFEIRSDGLHMFPRLEEGTRRRVDIREQTERLGFAVPNLDAMLNGGLVRGSVSSLAGSPGSGKTLLGLSFLLAGARSGEPAFYFGFYEAPGRLIAKAKGVGLDMQAAIDAGLLEVHWEPPVELLTDELGHILLETAERVGAKRLFIDGVEGFLNSGVYPDRFGRFLTALTTRLRERSITTLLSEELPIFALDIQTPVTQLSAIVENLMLMRQVELGSRLRRLLSIMKLRESSYDSTIREFTISADGIDLAEPFESAEGVLTGAPRKQGAKARRRRAGRRE